MAENNIIKVPFTEEQFTKLFHVLERIEYEFEPTTQEYIYASEIRRYLETIIFGLADEQGHFDFLGK